LLIPAKGVFAEAIFDPRPNPTIQFAVFAKDKAKMNRDFPLRTARVYVTLVAF
jgi:hypothetical protein